MQINPMLLNDSEYICDLHLCELRMMKNDIPWFVLIPKIDGAVEFTDLELSEQHIVLDDVNYAAAIIKNNLSMDKLNIATIGNIVSQLHIHIVARSKDDRAWPGVIWGTKAEKEFDRAELEKWKQIFNKENS